MNTDSIRRAVEKLKSEGVPPPYVAWLTPKQAQALCQSEGVPYVSDGLVVGGVVIEQYPDGEHPFA